MQFNEKFSNTQIDESAKGEAIKQGAKKAAKYARVAGKKLNRFMSRKAISRKRALAGAGLAFAAGKGYEKAKHESLVEKLDRVVSNLKATNEVNLAAAGNALKGAGKSVFNGAKEVATNVGNTAKTVGGAIKKHPVRTAAIAGTGLAGYGAYKGVKKAVGGAKKVGKAAYSDWKVK